MAPQHGHLKHVRVAARVWCRYTYNVLALLTCMTECGLAAHGLRGSGLVRPCSSWAHQLCNPCSSWSYCATLASHGLRGVQAPSGLATHGLILCNPCSSWTHSVQYLQLSWAQRSAGPAAHGLGGVRAFQLMVSEECSSSSWTQRGAGLATHGQGLAAHGLRGVRLQLMDSEECRPCRSRTHTVQAPCRSWTQRSAGRRAHCELASDGETVTE